MPSGKRLDSTDITQPLSAAADVLGLSIDARQQHALQGYLEALQRWNRIYNLTAIRDPQQMLVQHVFDSLAIIAPLRRRWEDGGNASPDQTVHALDAGSGAGLPGMVIAILQPHWHVTCVDAVEKKTVFIQQVTRSLGLSNVTVRHGRVEDLHSVNLRPPSATSAAAPYAPFLLAPYTFAVSRAFASLRDFAVLAGSQLGEDGVLVAMKAKVPDDEILAVERQTDWHVTAIEPLTVPKLNAKRCLIWLERKHRGEDKDQNDGDDNPPRKDAHAPR